MVARIKIAIWNGRQNGNEDGRENGKDSGSIYRYYALHIDPMSL